MRLVGAKLGVSCSDERENSRNRVGVIGEVFASHHRWLDDDVIAADSRLGGGANKLDHRFAVHERGATALVIDGRLCAVAFCMARRNRAQGLFKLVADTV